MIVRVFAVVLATMVWTGDAAAGIENEPSGEREPAARSGLVERTGRRLAQLDVTVTGPPDQIADLTVEDFELVVGGKRYEDFIVDRVCKEPEGDRSGEVVTRERVGQAPVAVPSQPATFLFYFDQPHLSMAGRNRAMQMAKQFIPELVRDGARGMVVSNADELVTFADLTTDTQELLEAVQKLEDDKDQWDPFAILEESRVEEIMKTLRDSGVQPALSVARRHQREERFRSSKALRRFGMVLGRLADLDPPKVVLYFADTMRSNAGGHYLSLFSEKLGRDSGMEIDAFTALQVFDRLLEEAASHGIRIYTIHAQGLRASFRPGAAARQYQRSIREAEDSLKGLALETGGQAFIGGYKYKSVVTTIRQDLSCLYLVNFDPAGLPEDASLPVRLKVNRPKVRAQVRGRIVVQSDSSRLTSRLLAAFGAPSAVRDQAPMRVSVVPIGFGKSGNKGPDDVSSANRFTALVQVLVPPTPISGAVWDLGATVISGEDISRETSKRVSLSGPGVPVVLETEVAFRPGPYEVVSVAHETSTNQVASKEAKGSWPDPRDNPATVTPIAVLQPAEAAFTRDGKLRDSGSLAVSPEDFVKTDLPTAFVGLVCWDKAQKKTLSVERSLSGDSSADFEPLSIEPGKERCASFRDLVPAGTMTSGTFTYEVTVFSADQELARATRAFAAIGADAEELAKEGGGATDAL